MSSSTEHSICLFNSNDGNIFLGLAHEELLTLEDLNKEEIENFLTKHSDDYIFMALSFNLKNKFFGLSSKNIDLQNFPLAVFWVPKLVVSISKDHFEIKKGTATKDQLDLINLMLQNGS